MNRSAENTATTHTLDRCSALKKDFYFKEKVCIFGKWKNLK